MDLIVAKAPGKVILLGEHSVVYDKLGIATAIGKYTAVKVSPNNKNSVKIISKNYSLEKEMDKDKLFDLVEKITNFWKDDNLKEVKKLFSGNSLLPSFITAGKIMKKYGFRGLKIEINSDVPKNLGSSASVFNAIALGVSKFLDLDLSRGEIGYFANEGDKVVHGTPSGIDAYTIANGGWITYVKSIGVKPLETEFKAPLLVVESGEPAKTGEMVEYVKKQKQENPDFVNQIMENLENISQESLKAIKSQDYNSLGEAMIAFYQELRKLNISTKKLDYIVEIAIKNSSYAKPTGGWGGGCCIILPKEDHIDDLKRIYEEKNYKVYKTELGVEGVNITES